MLIKCIHMCGLADGYWVLSKKKHSIQSILCAVLHINMHSVHHSNWWWAQRTRAQKKPVSVEYLLIDPSSPFTSTFFCPQSKNKNDKIMHITIDELWYFRQKNKKKRFFFWKTKSTSTLRIIHIMVMRWW